MLADVNGCRQELFMVRLYGIFDRSFAKRPARVNKDPKG